MEAIARIWKNRIEAGTQQFERCPAKYKNLVIEYLKQDVEDGVITAEQYEELTGLPYEE